jgi:hypothetical protein
MGLPVDRQSALEGQVLRGKWGGQPVEEGQNRKSGMSLLKKGKRPRRSAQLIPRMPQFIVTLHLLKMSLSLNCFILLFLQGSFFPCVVNGCTAPV